MPRQIQIPCDELRRLYETGTSSIALGRHFQCSPTTIIRHLRRCGITIRHGRFTRQEVDDALLRRLYLDEQQPIAQIAVALNVSVSTIGNWRQRLGIPRRGRQS